MASIRVSVDGDIKKLLKKLRMFSEVDTKGINKAMAEALRESTVERFKTSKSPEGDKWKQSIRSKQEVTITIPARPFLGISEEDEKEIKAMLEEIYESV